MTLFRAASADCADCAAGAIGFCAMLSREVVDVIAARSRLVQFKRGQVISDGQSNEEVALILRKGMVKISQTLVDGRHQIVDFLLPGDALFHRPGDEDNLRITVASTDVEACELSADQLADICTSNTAIGSALVASAFREVERKNRQIVMLGRKRSEERVASLISELLTKTSRFGNRRDVLSLPMSRAEIADYLGLTTETVSRAFSVLREHGIISLPRRSEVVVRDAAELKRIATGGGNLSVR